MLLVNMISVQASLLKNKKLDVYKNGKYLHSIGDTRYMDYHQYKSIDPILAEKRRILYYKRHAKDIAIPESRGYHAWRYLWND